MTQQYIGSNSYGNPYGQPKPMTAKQAPVRQARTLTELVRDGKLKRLTQKPKIIVVGESGVGKTTYAAKFPKPLILDTEGGLGDIDVDCIDTSTPADLREALQSIAIDNGGYETLIIDTVTKWEKDAIAEIKAKNHVKELREIPWGGGYTQLSAAWLDLRTKLDLIQKSSGMTIVLIAHAIIETITPPPPEQPYMRYGIAMERPRDRIDLAGWCDMIVNIRYASKRPDANAERIYSTAISQDRLAKTRYRGLSADLIQEPAEMIEKIKELIKKRETIDIGKEETDGKDA